MHMHLNKIQFYLNRNLGLFYASKVILSAAQEFFTLFMPLFLYKELLFPLWLVILIYGIQILLYGFSVFFGYKFSIKLGVKNAFAIGAILNAIATTFLLFAKEYPLLIIPFSIFLVLHWMMYFPASTIDEVVFTSKKIRARQDSFMRIMGVGINSLIPLLSGVLIFFFGFNILFIIAIILSILSAIPILFSKDNHNIGKNFSLKSSISFFKSYKNKKEFLAHVADGFRSGNLELFWPIFIFIFIPSYIILGGITTVVIIISIILTLIMGQIIDKRGPNLFLKIGTYGESISWIIKSGFWFLSIVTVFHVFFVSVLNKIMDIILGISMNKIVLDHADKKNTMVEFLYLRKLARMLGSSIPFIIFAFFAFFLKEPERIIMVSFFLMGIATLTFQFIIFNTPLKKKIIRGVKQK
jgi:hypothetical protein